MKTIRDKDGTIRTIVNKYRRAFGMEDMEVPSSVKYDKDGRSTITTKRGEVTHGFPIKGKLKKVQGVTMPKLTIKRK